VDYRSGIRLTPIPTERCPTAAIQWLEGDQFQPVEKPEPAVRMAGAGFH
jgi:hypothetical protein